MLIAPPPLAIVIPAPPPPAGPRTKPYAKNLIAITARPCVPRRGDRRVDCSRSSNANCTSTAQNSKRTSLAIAPGARPISLER